MAWLFAAGRFLIGTEPGRYILIATAAVAVFLYLDHRAYERGYQAYGQEMAQAAARAEKERNKDDARIQGLSDYELCVDYLRARRMPNDACNELRRVPAE